MEPAMPLLRLVRVSRNYEAAQSAGDVPVLRDISLEVGRGESVAIIGPSGSGKSTLLNLIGALDRPTSGQLFFEGQDLSQLNDEQLAGFRNRQIGFVFQMHHLLPHCSVLENALVPTLAGRDSALRRGAEKRARALLHRVELDHRLKHRPGELSGGERQRVAVVRALINQPQLLLADEPTGALDRASARALGQLLVELNREQGVTLIVVTHALDLARDLGRLLELREGKLAPGSAPAPA
jgi:lipoprotein-releasing system ATP-binding protein